MVKAAKTLCDFPVFNNMKAKIKPVLTISLTASKWVKKEKCSLRYS